MKALAIALFGEAEKGEFHTPYELHSLIDMEKKLGTPREYSMGFQFAIKTLLLKTPILYIRIEEEGFGLRDYLTGLDALRKFPLFSSVEAIGLPGVSDPEILSAVEPLLWESSRILITNEPDLYDFLMA